MSPFYDEFIDKDERKMNKTRSFNEKKKGKRRKKNEIMHFVCFSWRSAY